MSLKDLNVLLLDAQTTGIRPPAAHLLELAWSDWISSGESEIHSHLVALPEGASIPRMVSEITGLVASDLTSARSKDDLVAPLRSALVRNSALVIHYAQFEKPFLVDLLGTEVLPLPVLCTHQLVKRLFPNLPSQNIRATAGFFGPAVVGPNRAGTFVRATSQIWRGLVAELERLGLNSLDEIALWLKESPRKKSTRYEYRLDKVKRLELPDSPGIYRMLGKNGEVLYVGKATSLKSRVNSYFRGQKNRDRRKLEMLAQVWDLQVTPTPTPLEAALLESDEIKRLDPPYNVALKTGRRHLLFYARDFLSVAREQSREYPIGPYRNSNWLDSLQLLVQSLAEDRFVENIFYEPIPEADLRAGFAIFCEQHPAAAQLRKIREFLAYGLKLHRSFKEPLEDETSPEEDVAAVADDTEELTITPEDIAGKFKRMLRRSGAEYWRTRRLTKLLNARVKLGHRYLEFRSGQILSGSTRTPEPKPASPAWTGLGIDTYDRMSILLAEMDRSGGERKVLL